MNDGTIRQVHVNKQSEFAVSGAWDVRFPHGWGALTVQKFDSLFSWTEAQDEGMRTFSGTATYRKTFSMPRIFPVSEPVWLDLGEVKEVARAYLNGCELGISTFSPHVFEITKLLRRENNHLVVEVANTWLNRLAADDGKPPQFRSTRTSLAQGPKSGQKWRDAAAKPSGLLGPVRLLSRGVTILE